MRLKLLRALGYGAVFLVCAGVVAGCGGSAHFPPAQRAAIAAAQRHDNGLRIFPDGPEVISCRIPSGGPVAGGYFPGHCSTSVSTTAQRTRLDFVERGDGETGRITVVLDKQNRIRSSHRHGALTQIRN